MPGGNSPTLGSQRGRRPSETWPVGPNLWFPKSFQLFPASKVGFCCGDHDVGQVTASAVGPQRESAALESGSLQGTTENRPGSQLSRRENFENLIPEAKIRPGGWPRPAATVKVPAERGKDTLWPKNCPRPRKTCSELGTRAGEARAEEVGGAGARTCSLCPGECGSPEGLGRAPRGLAGLGRLLLTWRSKTSQWASSSTTAGPENLRLPPASVPARGGSWADGQSGCRSGPATREPAPSVPPLPAPGCGRVLQALQFPIGVPFLRGAGVENKTLPLPGLNSLSLFLFSF